jgi:ligand-binding SRPBCC domain-containing protein
MKVYQLYYRQELKLPIEQAWAFFTSPYHLNEITPDFFNVAITSKVPEEIYAGLLISYEMRAIFGTPMIWLSEISHCDKPRRFVYQQSIGPFRLWSHEVALKEQNNIIIVEDIIFYAMPMGWLGQLINGLLIAQKLEQIFAVRHDFLQAKWGVES